MLNKILNFLRYFWAFVFLGGAVLNLVLTITNPQGYAEAVNLAWPAGLQSFWEGTVAPNMRLFLSIFIAGEVVLGLLLVSRGRRVKLGAAGALVFGAGLLLLGPGATPGNEAVARIPNTIFELMMAALLFGRYEKTLRESLRRRRPVQTSVLGG